MLYELTFCYMDGWWSSWPLASAHSYPTQRQKINVKNEREKGGGNIAHCTEDPQPIDLENWHYDGTKEQEIIEHWHFTYFLNESWWKWYNLKCLDMAQSFQEFLQNVKDDCLCMRYTISVGGSFINKCYFIHIHDKKGISSWGASHEIGYDHLKKFFLTEIAFHIKQFCVVYPAS